MMVFLISERRTIIPPTSMPSTSGASHASTSRAVYQCDVCPKVFRSSYWKKLHMKVMHEEKDAGTTCKECNKTFSSRSNMKAHVSLKHLNSKRHHFCLSLAGLISQT